MKDLDILKEISKYNDDILKKYDYDSNKAEENGEKIYWIDDNKNGMVVFDVFMESTYRFEVDPYEEYNKEDLDDVIRRWKKISKNKG